jgi:molybdate transport system permease protein
LIGTPLAWWLAHTRSRTKPVVEALTALPLVLPPTVLGFYLLVMLNPTAPIGAFWVSLTGSTLTFAFSGLVVASVFYSLPFTVQPLQATFEAIGRGPLEAAATLRATPLDAFFTVASPMALSRLPDRNRAHLRAYHRRVRCRADGRRQHPWPYQGHLDRHLRARRDDRLRRRCAYPLGRAAGLLLPVLLTVYTLNRRFPIHVG